ncbi:MAG TPA: tripartite tricarboxylate transporter TctB family protein, partial [Afifellaceae bacterium]|nr:tripartite tricarboxylate transporter TctB family protein [Afifellaceae bacterium]
DLVTGAVLFVLSVAVFYGAWTMDRLEIRQIHPLSVPGLLPGLLAIALGVCSVLLMVQALRGRRKRASLPAAADAADRPETDEGGLGRVLLAAALCLIYALGLVGRMPFWLATAIFVAAFVLIFEWREAESRRGQLSSVAWALGIGLGTGLAVAYAFSELFLVRLP